ncbi:DUF6454 family protein [Acidobacteria bacterium AH-259-O06]|nr:DUF6454 family protein [Acidobacteria bacterium AH-259-O06]
MRFSSFGLTLCSLLCIQQVHSVGQDSTVVTQFKQLTKSTDWRLAGTIKMRFRTYHPQGMVIIDDHVYFSSVQIIDPTEKYGRVIDGYDRTAGKGVGYLFKADPHGNLVQKIRLGSGRMYHPGGIDYDGEYIWVPVAEYRPNSESIIYRVNPSSMEATEVFRFKDHIGGIVHNTADGTLWGINWGSRLFYTWKLDDKLKPAVTDLDPKKVSKANGNHYIDYQDCHYLKESYMLCAGLNKYQIPILREYAFGGIDLIELPAPKARLSSPKSELLPPRAIHQLPVPQWVKPNLVMTNNPFFVEVKDAHLRFYFLPEDDESTVYIYDAVN